MEKEKDINRRIDPTGTEYYDITQQILALSDELSEEIVLDNIIGQLNNRMDTVRNYVNYITLYREKYTDIRENLLQYDKKYLRESLTRLVELVTDGMEKKFGVKLGKDIDFYHPDEYLKDAETLYEFLFIRHFENLTDFFHHMLLVNRKEISKKYMELLKSEEHSSDKFVINARRKFKNREDIAILHFLDEIISDIEVMNQDGLKMFSTIISLDPTEEFNYRMGELLDLYGSSIIFEGNTKTYQLYMKPLRDIDLRTDIRNNLWEKIMEDVEVIE